MRAEPEVGGARGAGELDIERDSDVPISTQIFWQIAYQIDSGRLLPGARLAPVRELGATLRVNPNTVRAVYRRLADAGYVAGRHGAGTSVVDKPPRGHGSDALAGIVAEMVRRAAVAGYTADELAAATFGAAAARKRPGPLVRVLFAECTKADAIYDAERIAEAFPEVVEVEATILEDITDRLDRVHYDLLATPTFHADEARASAAGRVPLVAMLVSPGYLELVQEIAALPPGARVGIVCASLVGVENIAETIRLWGATDIDVVGATTDSEAELATVERTDMVVLSREALALGLDVRFQNQRRLRNWLYEFDPSGLELLRRAVERVQLERAATEAPPGLPAVMASVGTGPASRDAAPGNGH